MFQAAAEGCKSRVEYYVRQEGLDPRAKSENAGYTALDWATWAVENGVDGAFLDTLSEDDLVQHLGLKPLQARKLTPANDAMQ